MDVISDVSAASKICRLFIGEQEDDGFCVESQSAALLCTIKIVGTICFSFPFTSVGRNDFCSP